MLKNNKYIKFERSESHYVFTFLFFRIRIKLPNKYYIVKESGKKVRVKKLRIKGLNIKTRGGNNVVYVYEPIQTFIKSDITLGNNSQLTIYNYDSTLQHNFIERLRIYANGKNIKIDIGKNLYIGSGSNIFLYSNSIFKLGDECMISNNFRVQGGDGHKIYDTNTHDFLNTNPNIVINNHVWIGQNVTLLKRAQIPQNSIVGTASVVTKPFQGENIVIAGNPAKKVKENINWVM